MTELVVSGPLADIEALHVELSREFPAELVRVGAISSVTADLFDNGDFGSTPFVEFVIQYGSAIAAVGTAAGTNAIYKKIRSRKNVKITPKPESKKGDIDDATDN